jgi:hypothetical protein
MIFFFLPDEYLQSPMLSSYYRRSLAGIYCTNLTSWSVVDWDDGDSGSNNDGIVGGSVVRAN